MATASIAPSTSTTDNAGEVDYSLYLVTGRNLLPPGKEYAESLEEAILGGVTVVQVREKDVDTDEFIRIAALTKEICVKHSIPLIINDRVDVALAIGAHGVHLGQTDMSVSLARSLLPNSSIVGVSCHDVSDVEKAVRDGADYVGIGAIWGTKTKKLTAPIIGVRGVGRMLKILDGTNIKAVGIGGIKWTNALRTLHGSVSTTNHALDGVAIVSDIVASPEPAVAAGRLISVVKQFKQGFAVNPRALPTTALQGKKTLTIESILAGVETLMDEIRKRGPLVHHITNTVVQNQSANITLAVGASPIMATEPQEMDDLVKICGALLINIGTLRADLLESMLSAGTTANKYRKPIVLDPVGVGASSFRKGSVAALLNAFQVSVIKGNAGELAALAGTMEVESKGVDSVGAGFRDPVAFIRTLAKRERCVVVLTGKVDYISDGEHVVKLENGHDYLCQFTGSGCILGSCIASFCATAAMVEADSPGTTGGLFTGDVLLGAITGVLVLTIAAEVAAESPVVGGPGSFLPALIDSLWKSKAAFVKKRARISFY